MLATKMWADVAPEDESGESVEWRGKAGKRWVPTGFETSGWRHQKSTRGYQLPHQKDICRVAMALGKKGIWRSIFPNRENTGSLPKYIKNLFLHRKFNSNKGKIWRWNICMLEMKFIPSYNGSKVIVWTDRQTEVKLLPNRVHGWAKDDYRGGGGHLQTIILKIMKNTGKRRKTQGILSWSERGNPKMSYKDLKEVRTTVICSWR